MPNRNEAIPLNPKSAIKFRNGASRPVKSFKKPPPNLFRRLLRLVFNPITISLFLVLFLAVFLTLTYFWFEYSDRVDLLLRGEVFTRTAGIYSAPKNLRNGENIALEDLIDYLKSAGYVEKNQRADSSRSRYQIADNAIEIEPGGAALIDGKKTFHSLTVKFKKDGKSVASIADRDAGDEVKKARLEPKILSSVAAEGDGKRKTVSFNDLPKNLVKAITATEDRAFFEHYGVNFRGIARALWRRYEGGDENSPLARQGGSSITQQLVKNLLLSNEPTLERKIKEAYMSVILETRLSKEEIFTLYANQIYLGQQPGGTSIYGVGEAANDFFGKDVSALTLPEAALIAGIIRSPNRYNPYKNLERQKKHGKSYRTAQPGSRFDARSRRDFAGRTHRRKKHAARPSRSFAAQRIAGFAVFFAIRRRRITEANQRPGSDSTLARLHFD